MAFEGVYSVLPTPFRGGGDVDTDSLKRVVDLIVGAGVNGVTALGVTGEVVAAERARAAPRRRDRRAAGQRPRQGDRRRVGRWRAHLHRVQPRGEEARRGGGHGEPAAHAQAEHRVGRQPLQGARRRGRSADRRAGLSADFRFCDGSRPARAHREGSARRRARSSSRIRRRRSRPRAFSRRRGTPRSRFSAGSAACS